MKIVYIASSIIPSQTANSIHVMKMCQAFTLNGHEVVLIIPDKIDHEIKTGNIFEFYGVMECFKIIRLPLLKSRISFLIFSIRATLKAKSEKPDLIYTRFLYSAFFSLLQNLPTIYEIHSSFEKKIEKIFFCLIKKNKLKKIVVISKALCEYFVDKYKINEGNFLIAPDGADSVEFNYDSEKNKNSNFEIIVSYIGNLYKGRGIDIIAKIAKRCPWAEFHIVGGFPKDIAYWKNKLANLSNIVFYGHVPHKDVYKYMLSSDVLIAPYQKKVTIQGQGDTCRWMSPLKIFEYMAAGKVILSSDLPVLKEVLEHKKNSLLAPPTDINIWVSNLKLAKNNLQFKKQLEDNAKKDFEKKYTWKSRAQKILNSIKLNNTKE